MLRFVLALSAVAAVPALAQTRIVATGNFGLSLGVSMTSGTTQVLPGFMGGQLAVSGTTLYQGSHDGHVTAIDLVSMAPFAGNWFSASYFADVAVAGSEVLALAAHEGSGTLHRLDGMTLASLGERALPFRPTALAVVGNTVYVGGEGGQLMKSQVGGGAFTTMSPAIGPVVSMTANEDYLYVASSYLEVGRVITRIRRFDGLAVAHWGVNGCEGIALDGGDLIVAGGVTAWGDEPGLSRLDPVTGDTRGFVRIPGRVTDITVAPVLACGPDINRDGALNMADFGAFQTAFALGLPVANYDHDWSLTIADFGAFRTAFAVGCR